MVGGLAGLSLLLEQIRGGQGGRREIRQRRPDLDVDLAKGRPLVEVEHHGSRSIATDRQREHNHRDDAFAAVGVAHIGHHLRRLHVFADQRGGERHDRRGVSLRAWNGAGCEVVRDAERPHDLPRAAGSNAPQRVAVGGKHLARHIDRG